MHCSGLDDWTRTRLLVEPFSRLAITIPLALFVGCTFGGGIGYLGGVFLGLLPRCRGDYGVRLSLRRGADRRRLGCILMLLMALRSRHK